MQPLWSALDAHVGARAAVLAVSGGPDSRALLEVVARWPGRSHVVVTVASVDHGTRPESGAEADAVVARAHALGFDAVVLRLDFAHGRGEGPLRDARYRALFHAAAQRGA
ncbi:MAG TPA: ATP-binding protein, partial [Myxococcota bacterium]